MVKKHKIAVLGAGSWATAIVKMLCESDLDNIIWYMRSEQLKKDIERYKHNPNYLSSVELHTDRMTLTNNINDVALADILILVIPSAFLEAELNKITVPLDKKLIFSAIKGIIPESGLVVGDHLIKKYGLSTDQIGVISGPCHAEEVALEKLSYLTLACVDERNAQKLAAYLESDYIKTKISRDVVGIEYATMLKNIYAIAAGIAHGVGYGDNFQSVLMSNSIREMRRFIKYIHKDSKRNINGSAYLGDLLVTGYSVFSRNRMFGTMIGKGYTVQSAKLEMNMIAEGYYAVQSAYAMCKESPEKFSIIHGIYEILYLGRSAKKILKKMADALD